MGAKFLKGLLMAIVAVLVTAFNDPEGIVWSVLIITMIGTAVVYIGKNAFYGSNSNEGKLNLRDIMSALLIAVGTAIVSGAAGFIVEGSIDWLLMGKTVLGVVFTYLGSTVFTGQPALKKAK